MTADELKRNRRQYLREQSSSRLLRELSQREKNPRLARELSHLADLEQKQADIYRASLSDEAGPISAGLCWTDKVLSTVSKVGGARSVLPAIAARAAERAQAYSAASPTERVTAIETDVAAAAAELAHGAQSPLDIARDHRRQTAANGSLRAAVFGINDGLVSNLSLVMGVAGASPSPQILLLTGFAGLLAGACSMAAGEYISMLSQKELLEKQLNIEREHLRRAPDQERKLLAERYAERGVPEVQANFVAGHLLVDPDQALDVIAREQLGLDPDDLGSPVGAATASFLSFAVGAIIPILPYTVLVGPAAVIVSAALSMVALFLVGWAVGLFTGRAWIVSALRMVAVGAAAAGVTFVIGHVVGVNLGG